MEPEVASDVDAGRPSQDAAPDDSALHRTGIFRTRYLLQRLASFREAEDRTHEALIAHHDRVMVPMAIVGIIILVPLGINDFIQGLYAMGVAAVVLIVTLAIDITAVWRGKSPPIPYPWLLLPMSASIATTFRGQGIVGAMWCYPAVLFFHFVLPWRAAVVCSGVLLAVAGPLVFRTMGSLVGVRFAITLTLAVVITNILLGVIRDLQRRLVVQATTDPLTGAFNRRHLDAFLGAFEDPRGRRPREASLVLFDIDHFKRVNDDLGHHAGDRVLVGLAKLVRQRVRADDVLFRLGGEEFLLFLPGTSESAAVTVAEDLRIAVAEAPLAPGRPITVSAGVAGGRPGASLDAWLRAADRALYRAKGSGRNRVAWDGEIPAEA
jgi:diguanylate cyclase (GGDEF)-like protein